MKTLNQEISNEHQNSRWRKILKGLGLGAGGGAIVGIGITVMVIDPASFFDRTPSMVGGTTREWAIIITSFWGLIGAAAGGILGMILSFVISQPIGRKWKWIIIGVLAVLIALYFLFMNTTFFR